MTMKTINKPIKYSDILLKQLLEDDAVLVDVRTHCEFVGFHLPNAHNICLEEIPCQLERIKSWKKPVIVYSTYGQRSEKVYELLKKKGIEVYDAVSQERIMHLLSEFN